MALKNIKTIAFDADDTLWENEILFRNAEKNYCSVLSEFQSKEKILSSLLLTELGNMEIYGYGIKAFVLSMIENAFIISDKKITASQTSLIIDIGKKMLKNKVILMDGVKETLSALYGQFNLILATKGDLLDQERKLKESGLLNFFSHVEIMTEKHEENFKRLLNDTETHADNFLMVGNSVKSDILPVLNLGGHAAYIPYKNTWALEYSDSSKIENDRFFQLKNMREIPTLFSGSEKQNKRYTRNVK